MDSSNANRPALPPIHFLDADKLRREEAEYKARQQHRDLPPSTLPPPTASYPAGPPPPYSAAVHNVANPSATPHSHTPDLLAKRNEHMELKTSLPSLSEALGVDRRAAYNQEPSVPTTASTPQSVAATRSPPSPVRHRQELSPPRPRSFAPPQPAHAPSISPVVRQYAGEPHDFRRPEYVDSHRQYPRSPPPSQNHRSSYPGSDQGRAYDASPQGPPVLASHFSYGYAHPSASYTSAAPAPPTSAPAYPPQTVQASPESAHNPGPSSSRSQAYSESVKRHMDLYDVEEVLNEIAIHSTITLDFSRQYGARLHNTQRSGITPGTLPAITEVDDLINKSRQAVDALGRLRESLIAHQAACHQQTQEHLRLSTQEGRRNDSVHLQSEAASKTGAGGFAGSEPKKRRGRNAAPGRCHSCNRAETPEWRRGPDGARTLCNACGLHYAKLTRKAGANKAAVGSSSLRPKDEGAEA